MLLEKRKCSKFARFCVGILLIPGLLQSCYVAEQSYHHLRNYFSLVPIEKAIEDPANAEYAESLKKVDEIKQFAIRHIGLSSTESYSEYLRIEGEGITHNVTASGALSLEPYTWWFPLVGSVPYKGYFDKEKMLAEAKELEKEGYDVWTFAASAYSTLGFFDDPVNTVMLRQGLGGLAETVIHEMVHETLYVSSQTKFNEQLASFVGKKGMEQYLQTSAEGEALLKRLRIRRQIFKQFRTLMRETYTQAGQIYDDPKTDNPTKLKLKKELFGKVSQNIRSIYPQAPAKFISINNARLIQYRRYDDESRVFSDLWQESNGDWKVFWELLNGNLDEYIRQVNAS